MKKDTIIYGMIQDRPLLIYSGFLIVLLIYIGILPFLKTPKKEVDKLFFSTIYIMEERGTYSKSRDFEIREICSKVYFESKKYNIDPELILSLIHVESDFRTQIKSRANAIGIMQIVPDKEKMKNLKMSKEDLYDPMKNIEAGLAELSYYIKTKNNIVLALYRYNGARINHGYKVTTISKESYWYAVRIMDLYYEYKTLEKGEVR